MDALLLSWGGAVPVRETGHVLAFRPTHQGRVAVLVCGRNFVARSMRAERFKMMKGATTLPIEHDTSLAGKQDPVF
jgi:hypothetical protein